MPYINIDPILDSSDKENREDVTMDLMIQNLPLDNNKIYIKHNQKKGNHLQ